MKRSSFIKSLGLIVASPKIPYELINVKQSVSLGKHITLSALVKAQSEIKNKFSQYELKTSKETTKGS